MPPPLPTQRSVSDDGDFLRVQSDILGPNHSREGIIGEQLQMDDALQRNLVELDAESTAKRQQKLKGDTTRATQPWVKKSALKPAPLSPLVVRILDHEEDTDIENEGDSSDSIPSISELELQAKRERTINTRKRSRPRRGTAVEEAAKVEEPPTKVLRGRGRPPKSSAETVNGKAVKTSKLNSANTADAQAEEHDSTPSRGSRAAAQSAKLSIANQSIKRKKRATATFSSTASTVSSKRPKTQGAAAKTRGRPKQTLYEVEKIVGRKDNAVGTKLYLVKWVNYPSSENTWEPLAHLDGCLGLVHAFDQKQAKSTASKNTNKKKAK